MDLEEKVKMTKKIDEEKKLFGFLKYIDEEDDEEMKLLDLYNNKFRYRIDPYIRET